jgi:nitroreductase
MVWRHHFADELIRKILDAGVCAPSGGNMQRWRFLVVRDPKVKETVGACYKRAWDEQVAPRYRSGEKSALQYHTRTSAIMKQTHPRFCTAMCVLAVNDADGELV